ncbi:MAG: methylated-DNA-protein-cysteine methyltransferase [Candidatus Falkowbacteria bacterium GW2011_GWC2_38_22]|uniref:methylated-DNA--[protein]-cysteine S-methyltransferase n=1 Tax=Candidatus Falkowbacteria bacterium GW2011_GWE1_38_31 TaxID=1618638 RepID=A0A0G0K352_9BACT|nr:MAG: methylated-DNA-protein-cysteine methyltransferase [Candidatus Falkowbacteria bacterium GW2011_GWF2_38_1205]KKQ61301.1 MAG: methylated-DNA-protein-cysteine methyltransferase [Candidatus Falkowbacteria bacterium GW2011_GWC2_38_22]KKQ63127.1 MAG: methylated-DNA-protein-cysteine methyltransferase [Candidatus Falkowbacteria bacterium GW2011_GWF1_38_22]KKQ65324.1 MAG: methylated-DNA-protein-cysteine methyltransferase [Candidatus Falkowbacteria bacterium GW2011_GWE2_38_254]KKQ69900.1 MAG: meth
MDLGIFEKKVLKKLLEIPSGKVSTYKLLAIAVKNPKAVRAVGNALHKNLDAPRVPCHRIVKSDGGLGGYGGGQTKKIKLLESEGVKVKNGRVLDFEKIIFRFK